MDFSNTELKLILKSLYKTRGEVAGATQAQRKKLSSTQKVIDKIEAEVGPVEARLTAFDRKMNESLAVLKTGKTTAANKRKPSAK